MALLDQLQTDMKAALKAGHKDRLGVLRMLISDVKNVDLADKPTTPEDAVAAYAKKLRKSADEYQKLGRADEARRLHEELAVVEEYLPKKASPEQTEVLVDTFLAGQTYTEKQIGAAMGAFLKAHAAHNVEPGVVNALLRKKLAGK